jgi:hypothetical protein
LDKNIYDQDYVDELFDNTSNKRWEQNPNNEIPKIDRKGFYNGPDKHRPHKRSLDENDNTSRFTQFIGVLRHMAVVVKQAGRYL